MERIARQLEIRRQTVAKMVENLVKSGALTYEVVDSQRPRRYAIHSDGDVRPGTVTQFLTVFASTAD